MSAWDTRSGYGWISIALHWLGAGAVVTLWFTGSLSQIAASPERYEALIRTHMSLALTAYALLWARIIWRFAAGHPGPGPTQHGPLLVAAKYVHYLLVLAIAAMLISGPLMVWTGGGALRFYDLAIPSPFGGPYDSAHRILRQVHGVGGVVILLATLLHIGAVILHLAIMRDGSFDRIMIADRARAEDLPRGGARQALHLTEQAAHEAPGRDLIRRV